MASPLVNGLSDDLFSVPLNGQAALEDAPAPAWPAALDWPTATPSDLPTLDLLSREPLPDDLDDDALGGPLPLGGPLALGIGGGDARAPGALWLHHGAVLCACPDCRSPMAVRLWLMTASCWSCGSCVELTEEQEREVERLLARAAHRAAKAAAASKQPAAPKARDAAAQSAEPAERPPERRAPAERQPAAPPTPRKRATLASSRKRVKRVDPRAWLGNFFKNTPAWLVSLLVHFILLVLLALIPYYMEEREEAILLSTAVHPVHQEGGELHFDEHEDAKFDMPLPDNVNLNNPQTKAAMIKAAQDARELRLDDGVAMPNLRVIKAQAAKSDGRSKSFLLRDPRLRAEMVEQEGGTTLTEAAVARALRWLAQEQNANGAWSLHRHGGPNCDAAGTSLALLPYLGAGQTHRVGRYQETVAKGLRWMIDQQAADGDLRAGAAGNHGMYAHGQAAIVLCEAFAMEGDEELRLPAQKALDFIVKAQHIGGGWRYRPGEPGDTSVFGWQLMALQSGRSAGLNIPPETWELAGHYLDSVQSRDGARYSYMPRQNPTHIMTAEALLCRMYLGWTKRDPGLVEGVEWLRQNHLADPSNYDMYYWYYATQVFHHHGGPEWEAWNRKVRDHLVREQVDGGKLAGSWTPRGHWDQSGGRVFTTALAACTLEVYYRHTPIFRQIELDK